MNVHICFGKTEMDDFQRKINLGSKGTSPEPGNDSEKDCKFLWKGRMVDP